MTHSNQFICISRDFHPIFFFQCQPSGSCNKSHLLTTKSQTDYDRTSVLTLTIATAPQPLYPKLEICNMALLSTLKNGINHDDENILT